MLDSIDAANSFADSSATALLGSVAFRLLAMSTDPNTRPETNTPTPMLVFANKTLSLIQNNLTPEGWLLNTVDPINFNAPSADGVHSPEGQAFVLLLHSAWRDWVAATAPVQTKRRYSRAFTFGVSSDAFQSDRASAFGLRTLMYSLSDLMPVYLRSICS